MRIAVRVLTDAFARHIERLREAAEPSRSEPLRRGLDGAMDAYMASQRARFASASAGDGTWAEHAPSTVKRRGAGAPILNAGGDLESSLDRAGGDHVLEETPDGVREGTAHRLAAIHHRGAPSKHIPARPILADPEPQALQDMRGPLVGGLAESMGVGQGTSVGV